MYNFDEDFYLDEDDIMAQAFDIAKDRFVAEARKQLKEEVQKEINDLKAENEKLSDIKKDYDSFLKQKKELEREKEKLEIKCENMRKDILQELKRKNVEEVCEILELSKNVYGIEWEWENRPKCPLCDENRKFHFITPDGVQQTVDCKCKKQIKKYYITKEKILYFRIEKDEESKNKCLCYKMEINREWKEVRLKKDEIFTVFDDKAKQEVEKHYYNANFTTMEEAQKCVDYLNQKEEEEYNNLKVGGTRYGY